MSASTRFRHWLFAILTLVYAFASTSSLQAEIFYTEFGPWPGEIRMFRRDTGELHYRRPETISPNDGQAWPRLGTLTYSVPGEKLYFSSGLDARIYQLVDGRERLLFDATGLEKPNPQIRMIRCIPGDPHIYFSVVPTPQNHDPLSDGTIYALNSESNRVEHSIRVTQQDVGCDWWGAFLPEAGNGGGFFVASRSEMFYMPRSQERSRPFFKSEIPIGTLVRTWDDDGTTYLMYAAKDGSIHELDLKSLKHRQVWQLPTQDLSDLAIIPSRRSPPPYTPATGEFVNKPPRTSRLGPSPRPAGPISYPEPEFRGAPAAAPGRRWQLPPTVSQANSRSLSISGRVVAPGTIRFGQVELQDQNGRRIADQQVTNGGDFSFKDLASGKYLVILKRTPDEFYSRVVPNRQPVDLTKGQSQRIEFTLK